MTKTKTSDPKKDAAKARAKAQASTGKAILAAHLSHSPASLSDSAQAMRLAKQFEHNLLSLIGHELRTPLMNVLNPLSLLESLERGESVPLTRLELVQSARSNAERLRLVLESLLDLASLEAGAVTLRLKEVNLKRLIKSKLSNEASLELKDVPFVLVDPVKIVSALGRAIRLIQPLSARQLRIILEPEGSTPAGDRVCLRIESDLSATSLDSWSASWEEAVARVRSGIAPENRSWFRGVEGSRQEFLSRTREGLGTELALILWIFEQHEGQVSARITPQASVGSDSVLELKFMLPSARNERALLRALSSRLAELEIGLGSVGLVLLAPAAREAQLGWKSLIKQSLFRSSDSAFELKLGLDDGIALVLEDFRPEDVVPLVRRLSKEALTPLRSGFAIGPDERLGADELLGLALKRLNG